MENYETIRTIIKKCYDHHKTLLWFNLIYIKMEVKNEKQPIILRYQK